ncbi:MAG: hypothetical protein M3Z32_12680 [Acidobacteriota bacterium]|nr:hypothetical protein [Acidobacteriota bacterium]
MPIWATVRGFAANLQISAVKVLTGAVKDASGIGKDVTGIIRDRVETDVAGEKLKEYRDQIRKATLEDVEQYDPHTQRILSRARRESKATILWAIVCALVGATGSEVYHWMFGRATETAVVFAAPQVPNVAGHNNFGVDAKSRFEYEVVIANNGPTEAENLVLLIKGPPEVRLQPLSSTITQKARDYDLEDQAVENEQNARLLRIRHLPKREKVTLHYIGLSDQYIPRSNLQIVSVGIGAQRRPS